MKFETCISEPPGSTIQLHARAQGPPGRQGSLSEVLAKAEAFFEHETWL